MQVEMLPLSEIKPYDKNPRINKDAVDKVAASIKEFGFRSPIIIDKNNVIAAGHTRALAAKKLGLKTVPTLLIDDLTDEQIKAFRLVDNKTHEFAAWDFDLLNIELDGLLDFDMTLFGFGDSGGEFETPAALNTSTELDPDDYIDDVFSHTCPRCGFKYNAK